MTTYKVLLVGDSGVGKSSLLRRYVENQFSESFASTVGVDVYQRRVQIGSAAVRLQLWDTAGQERYSSITAAYYRNTQALLLVYDVSSDASFAHLQRWLDDSQRHASHAHADLPVVVVGNKTDLVRAVPTDEAQRWADARGFAHVECSAKTDTAVDQLFLDLARACAGKAPASALAPDAIELTSNAEPSRCCLAQ